MPITMRIEHRSDGRWYVTSEAGRPLGDYATEVEAKERLRQVEAHKHAAGAESAHAMATADGALHHDELLGEPRAMTRNLLTVPAWRFSISTGRWDQFAKLGRFEKDGATVVFDERTLGQIVDNFAAQWLQFRSLPTFQPDKTLFDSFDPPLLVAMQRETELPTASAIARVSGTS